MKKLALIALLGISGIANAAYMASYDNGPIRRDIYAQDPVLEGTVVTSEPMVTHTEVTEAEVTPADVRYYYTPYGQRPVASTVQGATDVAAGAVESVGSAAASVIPF